jgi:DNA-binding response OmpR family regulator
MANEGTMFDFGFYFTDFFPIFAADFETDAVPLVLIETENNQIRFLFRNLLHIWKYEVVESADFTETLSLIVRKRPTIILLDCVNPFEETLLKIRTLRERKISKQIPIIVFSEFIEAGKRKKILKAGADDHLFKPVNFLKLESLIKKNMEKYYQKNQCFGELQ